MPAEIRIAGDLPGRGFFGGTSPSQKEKSL